MDTAQLAAVASGNRVHRSFAFIDLSGFTDFVDAHGDEAAVEELQRLRASVREVTPLFGVRVEKWLGDGCMIVGVDNEPVVAAVVAIQQRHLRNGALPLRAGIATGAVLLLEGDDYIGRAVNVAARLCDMAEASVVLATPDELHLPTWVHVAEERTVNIRGIGDPIGVVALAAEPSMFESPRPAGVLVSLVDGLTRRIRP
jgi:class 3 adenylate cyclase